MSTDNPFESSAIPPGKGYYGGDPAAAAAKVSGPAITLIVVGVLNALLALFITAQGVMIMLMPADQLRQQMEAQNPQLQQEQLPFDPAVIASSMGVGYIVVSILALILSVVIILGAVKMKNLQSWGFAAAAAVLAMIPCLSPCCIIGLPVGIWALMVLNDPDVKTSFT